MDETDTGSPDIRITLSYSLIFSQAQCVRATEGTGKNMRIILSSRLLYLDRSRGGMPSSEIWSRTRGHAIGQ